MDELQIRKAVREAYAGRAGCGCSDSHRSSQSCCATSQEANEPGKLGIDDTVTEAEPQPGEVVLDLGSGTGVDVFRAADLVGKGGKVIGVDATPEMIQRARETARIKKVGNVEFRLGEIEHLPIERESVDVVISDCVVNLSPEKEQVFREAHRVLKPGGRIVVSDVVTVKDLPESIRSDTEAWASCVAGAVKESDYLGLLRKVGFEDVRTARRGPPTESLISKAVIFARKASSTT